MSIHIRTAVEKLKDHYIQHLIKSKLSDESEEELRKLTLTELKTLINSI
ncbi:Fur-regulated basic protein FbpA [Mesobacillus subterraneus]|nr:Fur-regulated basic protein FbpA [Mesobacillus subterraneus]WLR57117.1 Fur-regulated basic protein FbpA [Mesobacillus subterraneus]